MRLPTRYPHVLVVISLVIVSCNREPSLPAQSSPTPKQIAAADLSKLRWIEGTWKGSGGGVPDFYERYHFENPTTLVMETLADEKLDRVTETARYELKDGRFANPRSVATALDDQSITFESLSTAGNSYRWERESANAWKAVLKWPASAGREAGERVYRLQRWPAR